MSLATQHGANCTHRLLAPGCPRLECTGQRWLRAVTTPQGSHGSSQAPTSRAECHPEAEHWRPERTGAGIATARQLLCNRCSHVWRGAVVLTAS
jgi:hypothetical protein